MRKWSYFTKHHVELEPQCSLIGMSSPLLRPTSVLPHLPWCTVEGLVYLYCVWLIQKEVWFGRTGPSVPSSMTISKTVQTVFQSLLLCLFLFLLFPFFPLESWGWAGDNYQDKQIIVSFGPLPGSSPFHHLHFASSLVELTHLDLEESNILWGTLSSCCRDCRT